MILELTDAPWSALTVLRHDDPFSPVGAKLFDQLVECLGINARQGPKLPLAYELCAVKLCQRKGLLIPSSVESQIG